MNSPAVNFLFLFPDQWRWDWLGCETSPYGKVPVQTPHIDALARRGVRFTGCRTNSPVCSPARACLTQGVRYHRCGVPGNGHSTPTGPINLFQSLRNAGYHTMTCGKSDLFKPLKEPTRSGFLPIMEALGFADGIDHRGKGDAIGRARARIDEPYTCMLRERGLLQLHLADYPEAALQRPAYPTPLPADAYTDDFCGQNALKLLDRAPANTPWCLWVNFPGPHDPFDPPAEALEQYRGIEFPAPVDPKENPPPYRDAARDRLHYAGACSNIDGWVGKIIRHIEARGELDNTVIVFASDHGEMLGDHGYWTKHVPFEGSVRVPLIIAGPGIAAGAVSDEPVELIDIAATLLELADVVRPATWDSCSLGPLLEDPRRAHRPFTVSQLGDWRSITDGRWKLVLRRNGDRQLYDLQEDPGELQSVADAFPAEVARLTSLCETENPWMTA